MKENQNRLGEINYNRYGAKMKIISYKNNIDVTVEFLDESHYNYKTHTTYQHFKNGGVYSIYDKTVCGVGYVGAVLPKGYNKENSYNVWHDMLHRCYDEKKQKKCPTYKGCSVCDEWLCYNNFRKWYNKNYYNVKNEIMQLDKDILIKNNKIYSPKTCVFVPRCINAIFTKRNANRGNLPIGVTERYGKYNVVMSATILGKKGTTSLGCYDNIQDAFLTYKTYKEKYIKEVADMYKDYIPHKLYNALYHYNVEITD